MPSPLPIELRIRVVNAYEHNNKTMEAIAREFGVGVASVVRWVASMRKTGGVEPKPHAGGFTQKLCDSDLLKLKDLVYQQSDWTLEALSEQLQQQTNITISTATMCRMLKNLQLSRKKNHSMPTSVNAMMSSKNVKRLNVT